MFFDTGGHKKGMNKKRTPQEKSSIVIEFFNTNISTAEICRKHNVSPATFQNWKEKFLQGGKQALAERGGATTSHSKEIENLKRIIGEITIANDILKKTLEEAKR